MDGGYHAWSLQRVGAFAPVVRPRRELRGSEIRIAVRAAGVCGSDVPRIFELGTRVPDVVLGHEFAGVVTEVANDDDTDLLGTRTAVFPLIPCGRCEACVTGMYAQCQNYDYLGSRSDGGYAEFCTVPSRWHLLPSATMGFEELALVEPAAVALHTVNRARIAVADNVVIFGAGTLGVLIARWASIAGAHVVLVDNVHAKVDFARGLGFDAVLTSPSVEEDIRDLVDGARIDVAIDGTGAGQVIGQAARLTKPGGTVVLLGNPHVDTTVPLAAHSQMLRSQLRIVGVWNSIFRGELDSEWTRTRLAIESGTLVVHDLVTHRVALAELGEAISGIHDGRISPTKLMAVAGPS